MTASNPFSGPDPWSMVSSGYTTDTKPLFEQYCHQAMKSLGYDGKGEVLDVACGPGTLSLLLRNDDVNVQAIDFSRGMLDCFNELIKQQQVKNITTHFMDGQNLEFEDNRFDWAFSMFGLMFFPDRIQGFRELHRTLKPGGKAAVASWAPVSDSPLMQLVFSAVGTAFPAKTESEPEKILNLEDPDNFKDEMQQAGFSNVQITPFDGEWPVTDVEEFLSAVIRGSAPIVMLKSQLDEAAWQEKRAIMLDYLREQITALPVTLTSRAFIGIGEK